MPVISEQLKPIDTVNGFQIRPGFFREFGAVAIPGGVNFTIHTHGAYLLRASAVSPAKPKNLTP